VAELPGVEKDDLEIHAHQDTLIWHGTRRPTAERSSAC
jgi:HSP20 family molecular chaperone IbpA